MQDDLVNLDIAAGNCVNATVKQNLTFSTQGLPFGLSKDSGAASVAPVSSVWAFAAALGGALWMGLNF